MLFTHKQGYGLLLQAQKRKSGLLEDNDVFDKEDLGEEKDSDKSIGINKKRGMLMCAVLVELSADETSPFLFHYFDISFSMQITQTGHSTRS